MASEVLIELSRDQALVLFDWLVRTDRAGAPVAFHDASEQRVMWDLEALLERDIPEILHQDYSELLHAARTRVRLS